MTTADEQRAIIADILGKQQKLTATDLQRLRSSGAGVSLLSSKSDYFVFRMEIELIDAIRALDETSTKLIKQTNLLTAVILGLTVVGVVTAVIQVFVALRH